MKEKPLLFNAPMVRALIDNSKTMTRRIMNPQPQMVADKSCKPWEGDPQILMMLLADIGRVCPQGQPGDLIWVRETFFAWGRWETRFSEKKGRDEWHFVDMTLESGRSYRYDVSDEINIVGAKGRGGALPMWWKRPAIFMPRWASRINLEITGVRVERLSAISEADAIAEGVSPAQGMLLDDDLMVSVVADKLNVSYPVARFVLLWDSINDKFPNNWNANPWVWVVSFRRVS